MIWHDRHVLHFICKLHYFKYVIQVWTFSRFVTRLLFNFQFDFEVRSTNCAMFDVHIEIKLMIMLQVANIGIAIRLHYFCNFFLLSILFWFSSNCQLLAQFESLFRAVFYERDNTETMFLMYHLMLEYDERS